MISVIITAKQEARTIGRAVSCFLKQLESRIKNQELRIKNYDFEIAVVAPDKETLNAAQKISDKVRIIQDQYNGKAAAMNLAIKQAKGDILIFSDGDVAVEQKAVEELLKVNAEIVTGRPVLQSAISNQQSAMGMYEFWQECLVDMAHKLRSERDKQGEFLLLSGYLFLIKKEIIKNFQFPENLLTEDEYLSYWAWDKGHKIRYAPLARIKVKYPDNYGDWVKQKIRTLAGGYQIPMEWKKKIAMRSFSKESLGGLSMVMNYVKNFKQMYWMKLLFMARLHVWLLAWWKVKILKQQRGKVWERVESTKH